MERTPNHYLMIEWRCTSSPLACCPLGNMVGIRGSQLPAAPVAAMS